MLSATQLKKSSTSAFSATSHHNFGQRYALRVFILQRNKNLAKITIDERKHGVIATTWTFLTVACLLHDWLSHFCLK